MLLVKLSWHWPFFPYSFPHQLHILLSIFTDKKSERNRIPMLQLKAKYRQEPCKASPRPPLCQNSLEGPCRGWDSYSFLLLATWHCQWECQQLQFFVMWKFFYEELNCKPYISAHTSNSASNFEESNFEIKYSRKASFFYSFFPPPPPSPSPSDVCRITLWPYLIFLGQKLQAKFLQPTAITPPHQFWLSLLFPCCGQHFGLCTDCTATTLLKPVKSIAGHSLQPWYLTSSADCPTQWLIPK